MASQQGKPQGLPNPYAAKSLPNPYALATVADSAPVLFSEEQAKAEQKKAPAFHNPHNIKRPQVKGATVKKPSIVRPTMPSTTTEPQPTVEVAMTQQPGLDWWRSTADDDAAALDWKRQKEWEQREKKKQEKKFVKQFGWWKGEAPYRADKPSNLRAYRASGGYRYKLEGFEEFLQAQVAPPPRLLRGSSDRSRTSGDRSHASSPLSTPPPRHRFAPPANFDDDGPSKAFINADPVHFKDAEDQDIRVLHHIPPPPSSNIENNIPAPKEAHPAAVPPPPPPPSTAPGSVPPPAPLPASEPYSATISAPPIRYNPTISAPPVHYNAPTTSFDSLSQSHMKPEQDPATLDERPSKRTKLSKAEAMMAKMGYKKGQGLGKNNDGITTHLEVKARKADKRMDISESFDDKEGKQVKSQQVFDIFGGQVKKAKEPDRFGAESKVVVAWGCVDGVNWSSDAERDDGGIRQEMGQTFDTKFGRVERIYINMGSDPRPVYIKFASELSALNAVNRFHEGYLFRDRQIRAIYYPEAKFEAAIFDH